ncbi:MAG: ribose-phosphate diphosphokinase [archaeon]
MVIAGPASENLGNSVAQLTGSHAVRVENKIFPDGESYIRFEETIDDEVVVVQSTYTPQDKHLMELFLILDAAREQGAHTITAVVPYLAYARQDKQFRSGEALSAKTVLRLIESSGATRFVTFDVHNTDILTYSRIRTVNLSAMPAIAEYFAKLDLKRPLVLAPDVGSSDRAKAVAEKLGANHDFFEKRRDRVTGEVRTVEKSIDIRGRDAIIVDDIISTGSSIENVASIIKREGAGRIFAACTHPLLREGVIERLSRAGVDLVVGTDCVRSDISKISVAPLIADAVRE